MLTHSQSCPAAEVFCSSVAETTDALSSDELESEGIISYVDESKCRGCGLCVEACPYNAIELKEVNQFGHNVQVANVNEILCKGCGTCVGACLSGAIQQRKFEDRQIMAMIESYLEPEALEKSEDDVSTSTPERIGASTPPVKAQILIGF